MIFERIAAALIAKAKRTPYSHLQRADGSFYMKRFWLVPYNYTPSFGPTGCGWVPWNRPVARLLQHLNIAIRVHHILQPDKDRHLHDHPWTFFSVILLGSYTENRPLYQLPRWFGDGEAVQLTVRTAGSWANRRPSDRHAISKVPEEGVWTLFVTFGKTNEWGFYTPEGKIHHREYESALRAHLVDLEAPKP